MSTDRMCRGCGAEVTEPHGPGCPTLPETPAAIEAASIHQILDRVASGDIPKCSCMSTAGTIREYLYMQQWEINHLRQLLQEQKNLTATAAESFKAQRYENDSLRARCATYLSVIAEIQEAIEGLG